MKNLSRYNWLRKLILLLLLTASYLATLKVKGEIGGLIYHLIFLFTILMLLKAEKVMTSLYKLCIDNKKMVSPYQTKQKLFVWLLWAVSVFVFFASYRNVWIARHLDPATIFFFALLPSAWLLPLSSSAFILVGILILPVIASLLPAEESFAATIERYAILVYYFFAAGVIKNIIEIKNQTAKHE